MDGGVIHQSGKYRKSTKFEFSFVIIHFQGLVGHPCREKQCSRVYRSVSSQKVWLWDLDLELSAQSR